MTQTIITNDTYVLLLSYPKPDFSFMKYKLSYTKEVCLTCAPEEGWGIVAKIKRKKPVPEV